MTNDQKLRVRCPACGQPFETEVHPIVDVGRNPELKWQLLAGQLNAAICPHCGMAGILGFPFAYHDPDKELLLIFVPNDAGLSADEQQKLIGSLTQEVMMSLPPEKRKGYLFQPKTFILLDSLVNAVLQADGITQEVIEAQRKRQELIDTFLAVGDDAEALKSMVTKHASELDYEFFQTMTALAEVLAEAGDENRANALLSLRSAILKAMTPEQVAGAGLDQEPYAGPLPAHSREELLDQLLKTTDERELDRLVALGRPLLDYTFYMILSQRIQDAQEAGNSDEASRLTQFRDKLLSLTERQDKELEKALDETGGLLREIYQSDHPEQIIEENIERVDDLFFYVLTLNLELAKREGEKANAETIARLTHIAELAADAVEKRMPPRLRLLNHLVRAESDDERRRILEENADLVDQELLSLIDELMDRWQMPNQDEALSELRAVRAFVEAKLGEAPAKEPPGNGRER